MPRILRNAALFLAACLALAFLATCGKDSPTQPKPPEPPQPPPPAPVATRITITPSPLAFNALATTQKLTAVVYDQNGGIMSGAPVTWTSSDASVATVSGLGVVNAIGNGTARITARSGSASASVEVRVAQVAASIRLSPATLAIGVLGRTAIFQATVLDAGRQAMPDAPVSWTSSDESVATVNAEGVVTAVGNGTSTITATSGGATATGDVMVAQDASLIEVMPASARFEAIGQRLQLEAVVYDPDGSAIPEAEINWMSGDPLVVTVDDEGLLTAVGQGMTEVTAELGEASTSIPVAVMQEVAYLEVAPATAALVVGDTLQITARATDALGVVVAGAVIDWTSSDEGVATVDAAGVVLAVGAGTATVTAASGDVNAESHLEIAPRIPTMIEVMPESVNLSAIGATALLSAVVYDQRGRPMADFPLSWTSDDPAVGEVDEKGRVISVSEGATEITVQAEDVSATVPVVVKQVVSALTISRISAEMVLGDTLRIRAQARDALNVPVTSAIIEWTSSDESVAAVDTGGLVRAVGEGTSDITASAGEVSIAARITVTHPDRPLLAMLYNTWDGPNWNTQTHWLSSEPLDEWHGVMLGDDNRVSSLNLSNNNLTGSLPPAIGQLSSLQGLALNGNQITGSIPPDLGLLANLTHLYLYENQLSGDIPPELGQLSNLVHLCLDRNRLTGALPEELGNLANLVWLHLHYNFDLAGPLPATLTNLRLEALLLQGTQLCVPADPAMQAWLASISDARVAECGLADPDRDALVALYQATNGAEWHNNTNWLSDRPLNTWRGVRTNANGRVTELSQINNNLRGAIPQELGQLSQLTKLYLSSNKLTGEIPPELGQLFTLRELDLPKNGLRGTIPPELGQLVHLEHLSFYRNRLSGEIPSELGKLESLVYLDAGRNLLTGGIPPELQMLGNIEVLNIAYNKLSGAIPPGLGRLEQLVTLELRENNLTGEIPPELGKLNGLKMLSLGFNRLTGTIPPDLGNLDELVDLYLFSNRLTGPIPPELGKLNGLGKLQLQSNQLSGPIPPELGRLSNVTAIHMYKNRLQGSIPDELGQLAKMRTLDFSHNPGLSGQLPRSMTRLTTIEAIYLVNTGVCVPDDPEFTAWLNGLRAKDVNTCPSPTPDRDALTILYFAMGGSNWLDNTAWLSDLPLVEWHGVTTDTSDRVVALDIADNNLVGEIPPQIGRLTGLHSIRFENNLGLVGVLPGELTDLRIETLMLDGTGLCAPPGEVFQTWLRSIRDLRVANCGMDSEREALIAFYRKSGGSNWRNATSWGSDRPLGEWHGVTTNGAGRVTKLDLGSNNLTGTIHSTIGSLASLESLRLSGNRFGGEIPSSLSDLTQLKTLDLGGNRLAGGIPPALGGLSGLLELDLSGNRLEGGLPSALAGLDSLQQMILDDNELVGPAPSFLGELANLRHLELSRNALRGEIPASIGILAALKILQLSGNELSGRVPSTFGNLASLVHLDLSGNTNLEGPLPREMVRLKLDVLALGETMLCVPGDETFQTWFQGIPERNGAACGEMKALAYLTQATQTLTDQVPLVAGEPALLRVFLTTEDEVYNIPPIRVTFYHEDTAIHMVETQARGVDIPTRVDESALANSVNAIVPGEVVIPGLEMVIEIDPEGTLGADTGIGGRVPETGRTAIDVRELPPFNLTMVPFISNADPDFDRVLEIATLEKDDELFRWTRDLLPVAELNLTVRDPVMVSMDPVASRNNQGVWLRELGAVRVMDGSDDHYMGMLRRADYAHYYPIAELPGLLSLGVLRENVVAHALGHNMNLGHAPCGFRFQYGFIPDFPYPNENGIIGSWGYDLRANELIPPESLDLMSNCSPYWIGDFHFRKAMSYRLSDETLSPTINGNFADPENTLLLWGGRDDSGELVLEPAFAVDAPSTILGSSGPSGPYRISGEDAHGNVLFTLRFDIPEVADGEGGAFAFTVPVRSDWTGELARLSLSGPEGIVEIDGEGDKAVVLLLDSATGRLRGFMRDIPATGVSRHSIRPDLPEPGLDIVISRGVPDTAEWER